MAPAFEELLGRLGKELTHRTSQGKSHSAVFLILWHQRKRLQGESEGERTKEGFLGEASYSKAFPQLPKPRRKSPNPFTWHLRPHRVWALLLSLLFNVPANPNSYCPWNMPHFLTSTHFYMLFSLLFPAWAIPIHSLRFSSNVSSSEPLAGCGPHSSGAYLCKHCPHGRLLSFHFCLPHQTGHSLRAGSGLVSSLCPE